MAKKKFFINEDNTNRGFSKKEFKDAYGCKGSIQISSIYADEEHIWLGLDELKLEMWKDGKWMDAQTKELMKKVATLPRMHLSQSQVKELLPILQKFAETGEI